ncbi:MAG TPA: HlyD family secretion protein [Rhizomicrobium sp.]|jgi:membrane fusion protein (multidrug efflux system)|nr:HlyD family secretion protein [Rhizomicrobium sp.]
MPPDRHDPEHRDQHGAREDREDQDEDEDRDSRKSADDGSGEEIAKESLFKKPWVRILIVVLVAVLIVGGVIWWLNARHYEETDDAFIDTHIVHLSPQTSGQVIAIHVRDNQLVHVGDSLIEINSADAQAKLAQIEAQKIQARTQYQQALAAAKGTRAQAANADRNLARYRLLKRTAPAAVAQQQLDQAVAAARNADAQRDQATAQIEGALAQIKVLDAQIAAAKLTVGYTHIVAPVTGHIAQRSVAVGNYVSPGQEMLAIVPLQIWVTANFKETQLDHVHVGQQVMVSVDACGIDVKGHVDSIQRGAGQAFGILPPENATGNYVKVVQRVPVKIVLDRLPPNCPLGPGMSVEPSIKVR